MTKILLADDHEVVRVGFRGLLEQSGEFEIIEAESAEAAYTLYSQENPDIVVMDISMPGMGGLEGIRRILKRDPKAKILVLSMYDDSSYIHHTRDEGAMGYVTKRSAPLELIQAINALMRGKQYFSDDLDITKDYTKDMPGTVSDLSRREFEILTLLVSGKTVVQISESLHISPKTVSNHRDNIMRKLNMDNMVSLTRFAIRHHIIEA